MPRELTADEIFGTSKRINKELEELTLQAHSTIINLLSQTTQYRQIQEKLAAERTIAEVQAKAIKRQEDLLEAEQNRQRRERDSGLIHVP